VLEILKIDKNCTDLVLYISISAGLGALFGWLNPPNLPPWRRLNIVKYMTWR